VTHYRYPDPHIPWVPIPIDLAGASVSNADFSNANFRGVDLTHAPLDGLGETDGTNPFKVEGASKMRPVCSAQPI
jgi:Pentapeptide repeats (8 copies)